MVSVTETEYQEWSGTTDSVPQRVLDQAGAAIERALLTAIYDADDAGEPTDPDVVAAIQHALLEQVHAITLQEKTSGGGSGGVLTAASIDGVSYSLDNSTGSGYQLSSPTSPCASALGALSGVARGVWAYY